MFNLTVSKSLEEKALDGLYNQYYAIHVLFVIYAVSCRHEGVKSSMIIIIILFLELLESFLWFENMQHFEFGLNGTLHSFISMYYNNLLRCHFLLYAYQDFLLCCLQSERCHIMCCSSAGDHQVALEHHRKEMKAEKRGRNKEI